MEIDATEDATVTSASSNEQITTSVPETRDESSTLPELLPSAIDEENWVSCGDCDTPERSAEMEKARETFEHGQYLVFTEMDYERGSVVLQSACEQYSYLYTPMGHQYGDVLTVYGLTLILLQRERARLRLRQSEMVKMKTDVEERGGTETDEKNIEEARTKIKDERETREVAEREAVPETSSAIDRKEKKTTKGNLERMFSLRRRMAKQFPFMNNNRFGMDALLEEGSEEEEQVEEREQPQPAVEETEEERRRRDQEDYAMVNWILEAFNSAKNIYALHKDKVNFAYVLSKIGEVAVSMGDFKTAIDNYKSSLNILETLSRSSDYVFQKINLHYQLHVVYYKDYHFREAGIELTEALTIASEYLPQLREMLAKFRATGYDDIEVLEEKIWEIEELLIIMTEKAASFPEERRKILEYTKRVQTLVDPSDFLSQTFSVMSFANTFTRSRSGYKSTASTVGQPDMVRPRTNPFEENDSHIRDLVEKINDIIEGPGARSRKRKTYSSNSSNEDQQM